MWCRLEKLAIKVRAIVWLHTLRLWRYRLNLLNLVITDLLWISIYALGITSFIPQTEWSSVIPVAFWGFVIWSIITYSVWLIGGWIHFVIAIGVVEEHILANTSLALFLAGRSLVGLAVALSICVILGTILQWYASIPILCGSSSIPIIVLGLTLTLAMSISYAITVAFVGLKFGISPLAIDVTNILLFVVGGIATPIAKLPYPLKMIALIVPYAHAAEIVRYGALGIRPFLGFELELCIALLCVALMILIALTTLRLVMKSILRNDIKGVGRM